MPYKITKLQEYALVSLAYCMLGVQVSRRCLERKTAFFLSPKQWRTSSQTQAFYLFIFLGDLCRFISVAVDTTLQNNSCFFSPYETSFKNNWRSVCGEEVAAGLGILRCMSSNQEGILCNGMTGVLERVVWVVCWGVFVMGLWLNVCIAKTRVIQLWRCLLVAGSGGEKCLRVCVAGGGIDCFK